MMIDGYNNVDGDGGGGGGGGGGWTKQLDVYLWF
jgi:hypothetical protein